MQLVIEMGSGYQQTIRQLGSMGRAIVEACDEGLGVGVKIAAGHVSKDYLSGQALKRRTGNLAEAVDGWLAGSGHGVVGVREDAAVNDYKYLLSDEQKIIRPKKAKFLCIPIGENLTSAGAARYSSPRQVADGFFVKSKGKLLFGYKRGKKGKFRPMFVLVKEVLVQGTGALYDGTMDSLDDINDSIQNSIDRRIS